MYVECVHFLSSKFYMLSREMLCKQSGKETERPRKSCYGWTLSHSPRRTSGIVRAWISKPAQQLFHVNIFDWGHRNLDFMLKIEHWFRRLPDKRLKWNSKLGCHKRRWRILNIYFGGDFFLPFVSWSHYLQCGHVGSEPVLWWLCGDRSLFMWWWLITWCACHLL